MTWKCACGHKLDGDPPNPPFKCIVPKCPCLQCVRLEAWSNGGRITPMPIISVGGDSKASILMFPDGSKSVVRIVSVWPHSRKLSATWSASGELLYVNSINLDGVKKLEL